MTDPSTPTATSTLIIADDLGSVAILIGDGTENFKRGCPQDLFVSILDAGHALDGRDFFVPGYPASPDGRADGRRVHRNLTATSVLRDRPAAAGAIWSMSATPRGAGPMANCRLETGGSACATAVPVASTAGAGVFGNPEAPATRPWRLWKRSSTATRSTTW
ncbi:MAG: hypothetical protein U0802_14565 [Candidatus Binatia bacterium]